MLHQIHILLIEPIKTTLRKIIKYLVKTTNLGAINGPVGWNGLIQSQTKFSSPGSTDFSPIVRYSSPEQLKANLLAVPSKCYYMALTLDSEKDVRTLIHVVLPQLRKVKGT